MKTNMVIMAVLLLGGIAWGQDCAKIENKDQRIKCLEEAISKEMKISAPYKLSSNYHKGSFSEVIIDFSKKATSISLPNKIKKGDFYQVVVENFNPNRYSVEINSSDSTNTKALKLPTFADFSLDALTNLTSSFNKSITLSLANLGLPETVQSIDSLNLLIEQYNANLTPLTIELQNNEETIKEIIENEQQNLTDAEALFRKQAQSLDDLKFGIYKFRLNSFSMLPPSNRQYDFETALQKFEKIRNNSDLFRKAVNEYQANFLNLLTPEIKEWLKVNKIYDKEVKTLTETYTTLLKKLGEFKELIAADNAEKLLKSIVFLYTGENNYRSLPIQFKGEVEELSISFVPKDSASGLQKETLPTLIFPVENSWYWSVATSFYYSNLGNDRIFSTTVTDGEENTSYSIESLGRSPRETGFSSMLRVGKKFNPYNGLIGAHVGFGPGISVEKNIRPRLLFGGGISIGRKHNFSIDYGGILGYVDRISDKVPKTGSGEAPDPLITETMVGSYFSIGYMFKL